MRKHEQPNSGALSSSIVLQRVLPRCEQRSPPDRRVLSKLHRIAYFGSKFQLTFNGKKEKGFAIPNSATQLIRNAPVPGAAALRIAFDV
jgi:hypothetical protein